MSSTFLSLHYHVVFSTKHREPTIHAKWRSRLHEYLGGSLHGLGAFPQACGGVADHVHLLFGMRSTEISDIVREVKKSATAWIRAELGERAFSWQEGYAAFTVSPTSRKAVRRYIETQERHHRTKPFLDELKEMLEKAEVEYDPKYSIEIRGAGTHFGVRIDFMYPVVSAAGAASTHRLIAGMPSACRTLPELHGSLGTASPIALMCCWQMAGFSRRGGSHSALL